MDEEGRERREGETRKKGRQRGRGKGGEATEPNLSKGPKYRLTPLNELLAYCSNYY